MYVSLVLLDSLDLLFLLVDMRNARQKRGDWGEGVARAYLEQKGYQVLGQNIRSPFGEIDLVCVEAKTLVIVEVKTRKSTYFGYPEESVNKHKQHKLQQLAEWYWRAHPQFSTVRIDVVAIMVRSDGKVEIEHIKEVF